MLLMALLIAAFGVCILKAGETLSLLWFGGAIVSLMLMLAWGNHMDNRRQR